jgi:uncharacterized membrane protein
MKRPSGTDFCPACATKASAWTLLKARKRRVRCEHCGASLIVSGVRSAMLFDCLLAYPILVLMSIGAVYSNLIMGLVLLTVLSLASTCLSVKLFYRIHGIGEKMRITES